ncbi:hypothetical protein Q3G72_019399 [Acer saccharum]|nr:hypothetical protein Q3G72_019399 [Acer saccharum]
MLLSHCIWRVATAQFLLGSSPKKTLTMSAAEKINSFLFGCGTDNTGEFDHEAGILGLSQENASIVFQTAQKYNKIFSYCLPPSASSTGHLTFGSQTPAPANIIYTKLVAQKSPSYGLDLTGIGLGGCISCSDVGTYPRITGPSADIDTCYDFSKNTRVTVPVISFFFKDGTVVGMPEKSSLITYNSTLSCLGFSEYDEDDDESIIGNLVQRTMEVVYDVAGQRIGFAPNGCT